MRSYHLSTVASRLRAEVNVHQQWPECHKYQKKSCSGRSWLAKVWKSPGIRVISLKFILNKANICELRETWFQDLAFKSTPPQCAGMLCPLSGPVSPFSRWPPHVHGPCDQMCSRVALADDATCRTHNHNDMILIPAVLIPVLFGIGNNVVCFSVLVALCLHSDHCCPVLVPFFQEYSHFLSENLNHMTFWWVWTRRCEL